jgi:hypothetical protein
LVVAIQGLAPAQLCFAKLACTELACGSFQIPDLRILMKIAPIFLNKINGLQEPNPAV